MKLHKLSPILFTKDLDKTISFYESVLGFKKQGQFPNFASMYRDNVEIMFVLHDEKSFSKPQLTGSIFIAMENVDQFWESVKEKAKVISTIADREYLMRDFSIADNNGYELVFGEDISRKKK